MYLDYFFIIKYHKACNLYDEKYHYTLYISRLTGVLVATFFIEIKYSELKVHSISNWSKSSVWTFAPVTLHSVRFAVLV